jgi:hypothetical protein
MPPASSRPILVTGAHRSGTTWIGKTLGLAPSIGYLHEPFHPLVHRQGVCAATFPDFFTHVTPENEDGFRKPIADLLRFAYQIGAELPTLRNLKDVARMGRDAAYFMYHRLRGSRPLVKAPQALALAPWFADRFDADVVITIRHPAAFAGSLKRMGWETNFTPYLQPTLLRDYLQPFEDEIRAAAADPPDLIAQAALQWKYLYTIVDHYREAHPSWHFVRHEDVARDPVTAFRALYDALSLRFTPEIEAHLIETTSAENPSVVAGTQQHVLKRDSRATILSWKRRLTADEIARIRETTTGIAERFYSDDDW